MLHESYLHVTLSVKTCSVTVRLRCFHQYVQLCFAFSMCIYGYDLRMLDVTAIHIVKLKIRHC